MASTPSPRRRMTRNNLAAGVFVLAAIVAATVAVVILAGLFDHLGRRNFTVAYPLSIGVAGVETGSRVTLGGREIGLVRGVRFDEEADGDVRRVLVTVAIDKRLPLRSDAVAYLQRPLLGSSATINFPSLGTMSTPRAGRTTILQGALAAPAILASAGYGDEQAQQLRNVMRRLDEITGKVAGTIDDFNASAYPDAKAAVAEGRGLVQDARERSKAWFDRADAIMKNIDEAAAKGPALADDLKARVEEIKTLLGSAQAYLDDNRAGVDATVANLRDGSGKANEFLDRLNGELSDQASALLTRGADAMDRAKLVLSDTQSILRESRPDIRRSIANFRLGSDQLKATLEEVRAAPWRLLYRPDTRELEYELLYDSARSYAAAVSDLRSISESLMLERGAGASDERLGELAGLLDRALENYRKAEELFLDELMKGEGE